MFVPIKISVHSPITVPPYQLFDLEYSRNILRSLDVKQQSINLLSYDTSLKYRQFDINSCLSSTVSISAVKLYLLDKVMLYGT